MIGGEKIAPGIYLDMDNARYRAAEGVSQSDLKVIVDESPAHLIGYWNGTRPKKETDALDFGNWAHEKIKSPEKDLPVAIKPKGMTFASKAGKEWRFIQEQAGREILAEASADAIDAMVKNVFADELGAKIYGPGQREVSAFFEDPGTGIMLKCRFDALPDDSIVIGDFKTAVSVAPKELRKTAQKFKLFWQSSFYLDMARALEMDREVFFFVFAEKTIPHTVVCRRLTEEAIEQGRIEYRAALDIYAHCVKTGEWPLSQENSLYLDLPFWAISR